MKILLLGFLVFTGWSAFSTYIYVCKVKGLCYESNTLEMKPVSIKAIARPDTLAGTLVKVTAVSPENMSIYFAFDKSDFSTDSKTDKYLEQSLIYLNENAQARLNITGHTDAVGSDEYNQALGLRRAQSMQNFFESRGMPSGKIQIESKGEKDPVDNNNTPAGRANNRRAILTIKK
jgi:outer membrane protein OmpA-like peptidoglycan-associated protein